MLPPKWKAFSEVTADLATNWPRYGALFIFWLTVFSVALSAIGFKVRQFAPAFGLLFAAAYVILVIGQWEGAARYNLEPPLLALLAGLVVANSVDVPASLAVSFRGEFYVKTGIVLLGATVPFSLIALAGPIALLQASIVSLATFGTIYWVAVRFGLDRRFAATLGVGGAVCGVSAAIAIAAAVGAKKEQTAVTITTVILWAIVMIFALPLLSRLLGLPTGVAGAWIGTSEFADAAGIRCPGLWRPRRKGARHRRYARTGVAGLHPDQGRRPRRVDRHLGRGAGDRRDDALGSTDRRQRA